MKNFCSILLFWLLIFPPLLQSGDPIEKEKPSDWPQHDPPTHFHGGFQTPASVWNVDGGYFVAYEAGEFGGALFFLADESTRLKLLLRGHVNSLAWVGTGTYIAAGGLAHGREHGSIYRVWVDDDLEWNSEEVLSTWIGIPTIIMTTDSETAYCSIVKMEFGLQGQEAGKVHVASFEVHADGSLEYLGPPKIDDPATKPSLSSPDRAATDGTPSSNEVTQRMVLRVREKDPDEVYRMLWQRSFPTEYQELIRSAEKIRQGRGDPFAQPMAIPDSELTPDSFSTTSEWGKGLPAKVFEQLGFPIFEVEDGVLVDQGRRVSWDFQTGAIEIQHSAKAIAAFRARFPEFEDDGEETREENAAGKAARRPEAK